ncbi:hypothetical protein [Nocardioides sp. URHA0032]|uniref:hypothetical protein n=1 Tax=Nocardioides sp. URHA0032 TaxID=1380388 RepID=UPI00048DDCE4|nr:hypothetical protein [Nocardioides sp. URHA0032]
MARLIARRDQDAGYVFIRAGDSYAVPEGCRSVIKRNGGEFSGDTKEWRVSIHRGSDVVAAMRVDGHTVITVDSNNPSPMRTSLECRSCAAPYPAGTPTVFDRACQNCNGRLELVPPHACDDECASLKRSA